MITPNPIQGTFLHAAGGVSASACYLPFHKTKWSWTSFWIIQAFFAWIVVPLALAVITVPNFFSILNEAPSDILIPTFLLGAVYGFGGMSFGYAIRYIGYSLTYTISIGMSAILGTLTPLLISGEMTAFFQKPGANIIIIAMCISLLGIALCGWAGLKKEKEMGEAQQFNMRKGLLLTFLAGVLSAVFNISLEYGQPIADMAAAQGAGHFEGNAKLIVSTSGCFLVNLVWFFVLGIRQKTFNEMTVKGAGGSKNLFLNMIWSALAGTLWCGQFFFYGLGHVMMGSFQFASWVIHMTMLIFFSFIIGVIMNEWKSVSKTTYATLITALIVLCASFFVMSYGTVSGQKELEIADVELQDHP